MNSNNSLFFSKGKQLFFLIVGVVGYLTPNLVSSEPYPDCPSDGCDYHNDFPIEDHDDRSSRRIKKSSVEFLSSFIDYHITEANAYPDPKTAEVSSFYVTYANGNVLEFPMDRVQPKFLQPGGGQRHVQLKTTKFIKNGGFIFPDTNTYLPVDVPNLSNIRTQIHWTLVARKQNVDWAERIASFAIIIGDIAGKDKILKSISDD